LDFTGEFWGKLIFKYITMKTKKIINTSLLIILLSIIISFIFHSGNSITGFIITLGYTTVFTLVNMTYFHLIGNKNSWEKHPKKTMTLSLLGLIPLNIVTFFVLNYITSVFIFHQSWTEFIHSQNLITYFIVVLISCVIALFIINLYLINRLSKQSHE